MSQNSEAATNVDILLKVYHKQINMYGMPVDLYIDLFWCFLYLHTLLYTISVIPVCMSVLGVCYRARAWDQLQGDGISS